MTTTQLPTSKQQQFEQLFQLSRRRAYRLAYRLTRNADDAEDITQDAYMRAWSNFETYNTAYPFECWLSRIIVNRAIDLHRNKKRMRTYSLDMSLYQDDNGHPKTFECTDTAADPEESLVTPIMEERLEAGLSMLPTAYRAAVLLRDVEQHTYQEIATRMQCTMGTVRSRIHRGRKQLRLFLETGSNTRRRRGRTAQPSSTTVQ